MLWITSYPQTLIHKELYPQPPKLVFPILASAINATIANQEEQTLKVLVNNTQSYTAKELEKAGYSVEFSYNKDLSTLSAADAEKATKYGIVNGKSNTFGSAFKYFVKVTDANGNAIEAPAFADVKVLASTVATEITGVKLVKDSEDYTLDYLTANANGSGVAFKATGAKNAFGEALEAANIPTVESVKSLNPTIAYYSNGQIFATEAGSAKFEVKFAGIEAVQTVTVEVKASTEAKSIKETSVKLVKAADVDAVLTVLDQYGVNYAVSSATGFTATVTNVDNESSDVTPTVTNGKLAVAFDDKAAGTYTVTVKKDGKAFGSVTVEVVDTAEAIAESYKVVEADKEDKLNLTFGEVSAATQEKEYTLTGLYKGVDINVAASIAKLQEENDGGEVVVTVADEKVATAEITSGDTITVTAVGKGETTATVKFVAGAYSVTLVDSFPITVKNDTPQYTTANVALPTGKTAIAVETLNAAAIEAGLVYNAKALTAGSVDPASIKLVNLTTTNGKVLGDVVFKTVAAFGAKSFSFPVEITAAQAAVSAPAVWGGTEASTAGIANYADIIATASNKVTVNLEKLAFGSAATAEQKTAFWAVTAQGGNPETATAAYGGSVTVTGPANYTTFAAFNGTVPATLAPEHTSANTEQVYIKIGEKVNGEWTFLGEKDTSSSTQTIVWKDSTNNAYQASTFAVDYKFAK